MSATVWEEKKWLITSYCLKSHVLVNFPFCLCLLKTQVAMFFPKFNGNDLPVTVMLHCHSDTVHTQGMLNNKRFLGIRVILNYILLPTPVKGDTPLHLLPRWRKPWEAQPSWLSTPSALNASQEEERHRSGDFGRADGRHNLSLPLPSWELPDLQGHVPLILFVSMVLCRCCPFQKGWKAKTLGGGNKFNVWECWQLQNRPHLWEQYVLIRRVWVDFGFVL